MTDARVEAIVARCQQIEGIHWDNDTVARAEMVAREALASPAPVGEVVADARVDEIVTAIYRRFKDWSQRGFGPDDVTWCEVKADVLALLAASPSPAPTQASPPDEYDDLVKQLSAPANWLRQDKGEEWKSVVNQYDRAPFEAATAIQSLTGRVRELEQSCRDGDDAIEAFKFGMAQQSELREAAEAALASERKRALEEAAQAIRDMWKGMPNARTDKATTSFEQNAIGPGCYAAIEAVLALKSKKEEGDV